MADEVEIKFEIRDVSAMRLRLAQVEFREVTTRTHEFNTVYDTAGSELRGRGELLRLRQYGDEWTLTHKGMVDLDAKHKTRRETETAVADGDAMHEILTSLGFVPRFRYEKFRTEFEDPQGRGHVVLDETPIGNIGEIEGPAEWIDETAGKLGIDQSEYITKSYAGLFAEWCRSSGNRATEMTWAAIGAPVPQHG